MREHGHAVADSDDLSKAIERCAGEPIDAVVIDQCYFGEAEGWSIAPSLKRVRPQLAVILILHGPIFEPIQLPAAVDGSVSDRDLQPLRQALERYARFQ